MKSINLRLLFQFGGQGSGNFGHSGRPGKIGGSAKGGSVDSAKSNALSMLDNIRSNKKIRRLSAALMADGSIDDVANVTMLVEDKTGYEFTGEENDKILEDLFKDYELAVNSKGYLDIDNNGMSPDRKIWERYFYGKEVGGHQKGSSYAEEAIVNYLENGIVPSFSNAPKPATILRGKTHKPTLEE